MAATETKVLAQALYEIRLLLSGYALLASTRRMT